MLTEPLYSSHRCPQERTHHHSHLNSRLRFRDVQRISTANISDPLENLNVCAEYQSAIKSVVVSYCSLHQRCGSTDRQSIHQAVPSVVIYTTTKAAV